MFIPKKKWEINLMSRLGRVPTYEEWTEAQPKSIPIISSSAWAQRKILKTYTCSCGEKFRAHREGYRCDHCADLAEGMPS